MAIPPHESAGRHSLHAQSIATRPPRFPPWVSRAAGCGRAWSRCDAAWWPAAARLQPGEFSSSAAPSAAQQTTSSSLSYSTSTSIRPDETSHPIDDSSKGPTGVIDIPKRYLMGPGPANAYERILLAQAQPLLGHLHTAHLQSDDINEDDCACKEEFVRWDQSVGISKLVCRGVCAVGSVGGRGVLG